MVLALLWSFCWALICFKASDQWGRRLLRAHSSSILSFMMGHLGLVLPVLFLGSLGGWSPMAYGWFPIVILIVTWDRSISIVERLKKRLASLRSFPIWLLALAVVLIAIRFVRCGLPVVNWDSQNHHLPLLIERLVQGDWQPMWNIPTDRRTPLLGVMLKLPVFMMDLHGRSLVWYHTLMGLMVSVRVLKALQFRFQITPQACFWLWLIWLGLTDVWLYLGLAGDEPWLMLLAGLWIEFLLKQDHSNRSWTLIILLMAMGLCIKLTALFFLFPVMVVGLWQARKNLKGLCVGLVLAVSLNVVTHGWSWNHYKMIYPLQRWSDLLVTSPPPHVYRGSEIKNKREHLGLNDHQDNKEAGSSPLSMLYYNIYRAPQWGASVLPFWWLAVVLGLVVKKKEREDGFFMTLSLQIASGLLLAMCLWSFSPQAFTRYNIPLWLWLWASLAWLIKRESTWMMRTLKLSCCLLLLNALGLEGKALWMKLKQDHVLHPRAYWLNYLTDGPLVHEFEKNANEGDRVFYMGGASVLLAGRGHAFAQIGNEVGWREPSEMQHYLKREGLTWLLVSDAALGFDPVYKEIVKTLKSNQALDVEKTVRGGTLYRILD